MKNRNIALTTIILFALGCFALGFLAPFAQAAGPDTGGSIPGANNGEGVGVLVSRTTGVWNTGAGFEALNHLTAGNQNTATGLRALFSDTNGGFNTATGALSLFGNTSGFFNTATGAYSLANNTIGSFNTANGYGALYLNTEGEDNTATGFGALFKNTTGIANVAVGFEALNRNTTGSGNTAIGFEALNRNTTGNGNTAIGFDALANNLLGTENTAIGTGALGNATGSNNIALGSGAGLTVGGGSGNIHIGNGGSAGDTATIKIGTAQTATFIAGIAPSASSGGLQAVLTVPATGQLVRFISSARYKKDIKPMDKASELIFALKPVTFLAKDDAKGIRQFGLIAEEVAKVNPDLVVFDADGRPDSVAYMSINAMLLNEFLKEHQTVKALKSTVEKQEALIAQQQKGMEDLTAQLKEQASQIQKVSAQVEMNKPATKMVLNNP